MGVGVGAVATATFSYPMSMVVRLCSFASRFCPRPSTRIVTGDRLGRMGHLGNGLHLGRFGQMFVAVEEEPRNGNEGSKDTSPSPPVILDLE